MSAAAKVEMQFAPPFLRLFEPARRKIFWSGRGAGKTMHFGLALIALTRSKKLFVLCTRQFQKSIADSVHSLLKSIIWQYGLQNEFEITNTEIRHRYSGSKFIFKGIQQHVEELKSMHGIDILWIEEGASLTKKAFNQLQPTIRNNNSEVWISFNPDLATDFVYDEFVVKPPRRNTIVQKVSWRDNPWFPEVLRQDMIDDYEHNPEDYDWIWEGGLRPTNRDAVYTNWKIADFESPRLGDKEFRKVRYRYGFDWGFGKTDPFAANRVFTRDGDLYIDQEVHLMNSDLDTLAGNPTRGVNGYVADHMLDVRKAAEAYADNERPEAIRHFNSRGFNIRPCHKQKGSVADGIAFIQAFKRIYVHPRCTETIREFRLYCWKTLKTTDELIAQPIDKDNHHMDAIRYALDADIFGRVPLTLAPGMAQRYRNLRKRNSRVRV